MSVMFGAVSGWLAHIFYLYIKGDKLPDVDKGKGLPKGKGGHKPASNVTYKQKAPNVDRSVKDSNGEIWHRSWNDYDSDEPESILCEPCGSTPNEMEMNRGSGSRSRRGGGRLQTFPTPVKLYHTDANGTKLHNNRFCTGLRNRDHTVPLKERETCKLCIKSVVVDPDVTTTYVYPPGVSMINE